MFHFLYLSSIRLPLVPQLISSTSVNPKLKNAATLLKISRCSGALATVNSLFLSMYKINIQADGSTVHINNPTTCKINC